MADLFERPNKKSQEVRQQEEKESEYLKTIGKQKVEIDFLKKVQATVRRGATRVDTVEESCKVLSISRQCSLLGISRSIRISLRIKRLDIRTRYGQRISRI